MKKFLTIIAGCVLFTAPTTTTLAGEGAYVSGHGGVAVARDSDLTDATAMPGVTMEIEYDTGFAVDGALGYDFGNARLEGEVAFQKHDLDKATLLGVGADLSGEASALSFLINGYIDFTNDAPLTPYLTAGAGVANLDIDNLNVVGSGLPSTSDDDTVFAYQLGLGVAYDISETVALDLRYRYFATADPDFGTTESEFGSHNFLLGLKISF